MTMQIINVGSAEQAGDGESVRNAFIKINENFTEVYAQQGISDRLVNGTKTVSLGTDGSLTYPNTALQKDTAPVACAGNASTIVYTTTGVGVHTIKLLIQVEGFEGVNLVFDTQACEMIIAKSFRANALAASVYGVVHTSVSPLATFTANWNALTSRVEVVCTAPSANTVNVKIFATEITTSD